MKKAIVVFLLAFVTISGAMACHFEFSTDGGERKSCKSGEIITLNIKLVLTHRSCSVTPAQTKFKIDGIQVVDPGEWKQESPMAYVRKIKIKVLDTAKNKISLLSTRTCDKDGGSGLFTLDKI